MTFTRGALRAPSARRSAIVAPLGPTLVALACVLPPAARAEGARLHLDEVVAEARARNPELEAARARGDAAAAGAPRAGALADPMLTYEVWNAPSARIDRADNNIFRLSQKLPFPGKRGLARSVAERDADVMRGEADTVALALVAEVKRAYYELWRAGEALTIQHREHDLVRRYARLSEEKYAVGEVTQADVLQARMEDARFAGRVATGALAVDAAAAELNTLLARPPDDPLGTPVDEPRPILAESPEALTARALARRPELAAQTAVVAREEDGVLLARRERYPDFEVGVARFVNHGQRDGFGGTVSVSVPLVNRGKYDAAESEASARLTAARAARRRLEDRVRLEVRQAYLRAKTAAIEHDLFTRTHVPRAEQALSATERAYETGGVDFLRLLDSAREIERIHLEHIQAAADFEKAFADLERAVGTELPRGDER